MKTLAVLLTGAALVLAAGARAEPRVADVTQGTNLSLALSPDGRTLAVSLLGRLWEVPASGGAARPLTPPGEEARHPRFSPDGERLVYQRLIDGQWELALLRLVDGSPRALTGPPYNDREPEFTPDGQAVLFASDRGGHYGLWRLALDTGELALLALDAGDVSFPTMSAQGEVAYVLRTPQEWSLRTLNSQGTSVPLVTSPHRLAAPSWRPGGGVLLYNEQRGTRSSVLNMLVLADPPLLRTLTPGEDVFASRAAWRSRAEYLYAGDGHIWTRGLGNVTRAPVHLFASVSVEPWMAPPQRAALHPPGMHAVQGIVAPAVWRDGARTAFTALGDLWLVESEGEPRRLTNDVFVDVDPAFTPDGGAIVFASDRGGAMGLWRLELDGGELRLLTGGPGKPYRPAVSPGGGMLAYLETDGFGPWAPSRLKLLYLDLPGAAAVTLADALVEPAVPRWSENGAEIVLEALRSGSARRVLVEVDLSGGTPQVRERAWSPQPAAPEAPAIGLTWSPAEPVNDYVVQIGRLFDGTRNHHLRHMDIHVEGDRIVAVTGRNLGPARERVIDARELTVIPGLVDLHAHHSSLSGERLGRMWLAYGVTTVREVGGDLPEALERSEAWASGRRLGPRLLVTPPERDAPLDVHGNGHHAVLAADVPGVPDGVAHSLLRQARKLGIPHWDGPPLLAKLETRGARPGLYEIETSPLTASYQDVLATLIQSGVVITPTLGAVGGLPPQWNGRLRDHAYQTLFLAGERERWASSSGAAVGLQDTIVRLMRGGGRVAMGSDAPAVPYGLGLHAELALLAAAGIGNDQVLRAATIEGAAALGLEAHLGTLEEGKLADFVILAGDPLARIEDSLTILAVVKGGTWHDRASLIEAP